MRRRPAPWSSCSTRSWSSGSPDAPAPVPDGCTMRCTSRCVRLVGRLDHWPALPAGSSARRSGRSPTSLLEGEGLQRGTSSVLEDRRPRFRGLARHRPAGARPHRAGPPRRGRPPLPRAGAHRPRGGRAWCPRRGGGRPATGADSLNIAVIPARGGSKRIPRKNIRDFCGKPLIAWPRSRATPTRATTPLARPSATWRRCATPPWTWARVRPPP